MPGFFDRPDPQQSVPGDLRGGRDQLIELLFGSPGTPASPAGSKTLGSNTGLMGNKGGGGARPTFTSPGSPGTPARGGQGIEALLGLISNQTPGGDILGPLGEVFNTRLNDNISQLNASSPGRFSSANLYQQGQLRQRSMQDYNLLASQVLEQGRNRQLQAIMGLLNPVLSPTFGGPFTQGASGFDHLLGGIGTAGQFFNPFGSMGGGGSG